MVTGFYRPTTNRRRSQVTQPRITAAALDAGEPRADRIEDENGGQPGEIDRGQAEARIGWHLTDRGLDFQGDRVREGFKVVQIDGLAVESGNYIEPPSDLITCDIGSPRKIL